MKRLLYLVSIFFLSAAGIFAISYQTQAGSCQEPVTTVKWRGKALSGVNVREFTCMDSQTVGSLTAGSTVDIIGDANGWYQVLFPDNRTGFVWHTFITVTDKQFTGEATNTKTIEVTTTEVDKTETVTTDSALFDRLKGHILLQVENNGEAWYVHPERRLRYYMKDGATAYQMMREFGLGASNADIDSLLAGDKVLADRVKGKILLAVERLGEAYYIHPIKLTIHYLQNGDEAYRIMRELSLGITNSDLEKIGSESFEKFIAKKDGEIITVEKTANDLLEIFGSIGLSGQVINHAVHLTWSINQTDTSRGFKVIYSGNSNPVYPGDTAVYLSSQDARKYAFKLASKGQDFHFRVCQYIGEKQCGVYSNDITLFVPENDGGEVALGGSIELSGELINDRIELRWTKTDLDSSLGYKVLYSVYPNPTYPDDTLLYITDPNAFEFKKVGMSAGTYYFRICQYRGGSCGVYSNEVVFTVQGTVSTTINVSPYQQGEVPAEVDLIALNKYWLQNINDLRAESGLRLLVLDQRWINSATEWAVYMGQIDNATHNRPDGKTMHQWIDAKGLEYSVRYSQDGWISNYFTENIAWEFAKDGTTLSVKEVLNKTLDFYLSEASYEGPHYRTIYHEDWNSVGLGFHFTPDGNGGYKVYVAIHYGSLILQ